MPESPAKNDRATLRDALGQLELPQRPQAPLSDFEPQAQERVLSLEGAIAQLAASGRLTLTQTKQEAVGPLVRELAKAGRFAAVVVAEADMARSASEDIRFFCADLQRSESFAFAHESNSPYAALHPDRRTAEARLATLTRLAHPEAVSKIAAITLPAAGLVRRIVARAEIVRQTSTLRLEQEIDVADFARLLVERGYSRSGLVEDPCTFALRGGLFDLWPPTSERPLRIELLGDQVLSIKPFDPATQRSQGELRSVLVGPAREVPGDAPTLKRAAERLRERCDAANYPTAKARQLVDEVCSLRSVAGGDAYLPAFVELTSLLEHLPPETHFIVVDPVAVGQALRSELGAAQSEAAMLAAASEPHFAAEAFFEDEACAVKAVASNRHLLLVPYSELGKPDEMDRIDGLPGSPMPHETLGFRDQAELVRLMEAARKDRTRGEALDPLIRWLAHTEKHGLASTIVARSATQVDRISDLLKHRKIKLHVVPPTEPRFSAPRRGVVNVVRGELSRGVLMPSAGASLITEEEIFGLRRSKQRSKDPGAKPKDRAKSFVDDLRSLTVGDLVVHREHGVGRYLGLSHRDIGGTRVDLCTIEYAGGDKLYLPVYRLNQIQKFAGGEAPKKLDRLGGLTFAKTKQKAQGEARKMADELLRLYAERRSAERVGLSEADDEYRAFEATFPFEETVDQAQAILDVEQDLARSIPMDRLVCGDVGFGKTEVAIRATFRVAMAGRQVLVLCPTTVLAQQHYLTFFSRLSAYGLEVRALSRFSSKAEQDRVVAGLKQGTVDVVVGTHRLLSKDIRPKRLGLLVVDEEQRFGVTHKERIKQLRQNVDVLTLSATPIPRTLQMAVTGLRDMSVITTPPHDRRAIRTLVTRFDAAVLREAIERELSRGGQVFFVHNRIEGLYERAAVLAQLVPKARIAVAHGQQNEAQLERTMLDFVEGRHDILCSTAIIESGLDIPRANTIIIDRADMFGLAQLYQLRGRVGRSRERAYAYLVVPPSAELTDEARSRIEALERHSELGSGFQIASLDLELRGAGDLLGAEQSGTIASVGFELFCQLLEAAVAELSGHPAPSDIDPEVTIDQEALLPEDYIDDIGVRLSLYKRLASASTAEDVDRTGAELEDRFGPPPSAARRLIRMMRQKTALRRLRVLSCEASARSVTLAFAEDAPLHVDKLVLLVRSKNSPYKLTPDLRLTRRFAEEDGQAGLDRTGQLLQELQPCLREDAR